MTEPEVEKSDESRSSSTSEDRTTSVEPTTADTITALVHTVPTIELNNIPHAKDNTSPDVRRRSSVSIIQALANTKHLLTTNDARKR